MTITHSISSLDLSLGGPSRSLPNICIGLNNKGLKQQIVTHNSKKPNIDKLLKENIKVSFVNRSRFDVFAFNYKNHIKKIDGDIFHLHNLWSPDLHWAARLFYNIKTPFIISPRCTLEPWDFSHKKNKKKIAWLLYQKKDLEQATCIHATAEIEADNIRKLGLKAPIAIIPNGINIENYPYLKTIEPEEKTILFLSRISPKKGIEKLINAWISLPQGLKNNWKVRIVGEASTEEDKRYLLNIKKQIEDNNLSKTVTVVGPKYGKEKIQEYKNANLFVLPTYSENFGMVIAEAMASGVPVITTTGTPWKVLANEKIGWWTCPEIEKIRYAMIEAMSLKSEERIRLGLKSREVIIRNFSIEAVSSMYKHLYQWLYDSNNPVPEFVYFK